MTTGDAFSIFRSQLVGLVGKYSKSDLEEIDDDTLLSELNVDSIDLMEIVFELEDAIGAGIPDEKVLDLKNFGELCRFLFDYQTAEAGHPV